MKCDLKHECIFYVVKDKTNSYIMKHEYVENNEDAITKAKLKIELLENFIEFSEDELQSSR